MDQPTLEQLKEVFDADAENAQIQIQLIRSRTEMLTMAENLLSLCTANGAKAATSLIASLPEREKELSIHLAITRRLLKRYGYLITKQ